MSFRRPGKSWRRLYSAATSLGIVTACMIAMNESGALAASATTSQPVSAVKSANPFGRTIMDGPSCGAGAMSPLLLGASPASALGAMAPVGPTSALGAVCSLAYENGKPGGDCTGWHTIRFETRNASPAAKVKAELVAYDEQGIVIKTLPVNNGDSAHLTSRVAAADFKMSSNLKQKTHEVFAPIPVLRVTVDDNGQKATAYCSNIPWLQVIEPKGAVVTEDNGNVTKVVAAAPRVDSKTLDFKVDGVHILSSLQPPIANLDNCTASSPCNGTVNINANLVTVSNLVVDIAPDIGVLSSNTIRFSLENQSCGGHVYVLDGQYLPNALKNPTTPQCHVDDVLDKGLSSIFGIQIDTPLAGDKLSAPPTGVVGQVCSGRTIISANLNGKTESVAGQTCVAGDGENTGRTCKVSINDTLSATDIEHDLVNGTFSKGTLDPGSNRLVASATDDQGNRAFKRVVFTAGDTAAPGVNIQALLQQSAVDLTMQNQLQNAVMPKVLQAMNATSVEIQNAFVIGITADATQRLFTKICNAPLPAKKADGTDNDPDLVGLTPGQIFKKRATDSLLGKSTVKNDLNVVCAPDVDVTSTVTSVDVSDQVTCDVTFSQDKFHVKLGLPDIAVGLTAEGTSGGWNDDPCIAPGAHVHGTFSAGVSDIRLEFDVTEGQLMPNGVPQAPPTFTVGATTTADVSVKADFCGLGSVCAFAVTVGTLGFVDLLDAEFDFHFDKDFSKELAGAEPDPVQLNKIKVDDQIVANFNQQLSGVVSSVEIDTTGIRAGLKGTFATTAIDPEIDPTLGGVLTPTSPPNKLPTFTQAHAQDVFMGLADDTINMLFASMTAAGKLKGECSDTGVTVGKLLDLNKDNSTNAADCDTITVNTGHPLEDALATAFGRGTCYGVVNANCEAINLNPGNPNDLNTATAQGICHALKGDDCNALTLAAGPLAASTEKGLCTNTPNPNIHSNQKLLFCARQELPPRMLLADNGSTPNAVEATLRMNDLSVALVLDRTSANNPGFPDGKIDGKLADVPGCFATGNPSNNDCSLFASCLDVNFDFSMEKASSLSCPADKPGFVNTFKTLTYSQERGVVCGAGGSTAGTDSAVVQQSQTDQTVTIDLTAKAQNFAPPICGAGLNLGLFGACGNSSIVTMDTSAGQTEVLKDFIGLTCTLQ